MSFWEKQSGKKQPAQNQGNSVQELCTAASEGDIEKIKSILDGTPELVNMKDEKGWSPLHNAAHKGRTDIADFLISKGAEVDIKDEYDSTPLASAAWQAQKETVRLLIARGASVKSKDRIGSTPLHRAADGGDEDIVRALISAGAEVNATNNSDEIALHLAADKGHRQAAQVLIENGANVNARSKRGLTPLHCTLMGSNGWNVMEILVANGADVNTEFGDVGSPLELEARLQQHHLADIIRNSSAGKSKPVVTTGKPLDGQITNEARDAYNQGVTSMSLHKLESALVHFDKALEIAPGYATAWHAKGAVLGMSGRFEEALTCFQHGLDINPQDANLWFKTGLALGELNRNEEELSAYEKALELDPGLILAWYNKGGTLIALGKEREALDAYRRASGLGEQDASKWVKVLEQAAALGMKVVLPNTPARKGF